MTETVFDKILSKDIPAHIVYEDEHTLAFLDIAPVADGHTLVIHKADRSAELSAMSTEAAAQLMQSTQKVIKQLKEKLGADGVNVLLAQGTSAGQEVMHAHVHLIPRYENDGLQIHCVGAQQASQEQLINVANKLS